MQSILLVEQIYWCKAVEQALMTATRLSWGALTKVIRSGLHRKSFEFVSSKHLNP